MNRHNKTILVTLVEKEIAKTRRVKYNLEGNKRNFHKRQIMSINNQIFKLTEIKKELLENDRGRD